MSNPTGPVTLGIDLGTNSVGWALIAPDGIVAMGSRVFAEAVNGDISKGKEESKGVDRRNARQARRQTDRRARRLSKAFNLLQGAGLLPPAEPTRHEALAKLDLELGAKYKADAEGAAHTLLYRLRTLGLDEKLEPYVLGRALYHLAQRRGFLSNRKTSPAGDKEKEEEGKVKEGIAELRKSMEASGARTLGEYFSRIDPTEQRIRQRWTARDLFQAEFDAICKKQRTYYADLLTAEFEQRLREALFFQRPLKPVKPGDCDLEKGESRAPIAHPLAQRIRLVQVVNNLEVVPPQGQGLPRPLWEDERNKLLAALEQGGDLTMAAGRKLIGLGRGWTFNLEAGGEKRLVGNRTGKKITDAIGERWHALTAGEQAQLAEDLRQADDEADLARRLSGRLTPEEIRKLQEVTVEPGYAAISLTAMRKLLPLIEEGLRYGEARHRIYGETFLTGPPLSKLPPARKVFAALRNPTVERSLSELRKVANAVVRRWGKPERIHVEVARDLKNPKAKREEIWKRQRANEKAREKAAAEILKQFPPYRVRRDDIEKYLLWQECEGVCTYTGRSISLSDLFGGDAQFEVEHIIPRSRSLDNSFNNKTLCALEANRGKTNLTPFEAFAHDPKKWEEILQRVRRFKGDSARQKLRRFEMMELEAGEFISRQLNDTRYASKLAAEYLGLFYGGRNAEGKQRVQASTGGVTGKLRADWGLNAILGDGPTANGGYVEKSREDHRHHAIDALVIALTTNSRIKHLAESSAYGDRDRRREPFAAPWPEFFGKVKTAVDGIAVSHRADRKVSGQIHKDTLYSKPYFRMDKGRKVEVRRVRKKLEALTGEKEAETIADKAVRDAVLEKLKELGGDAKKFAERTNLPSLPGRNGKATPIRSARIERVQSVQTIGNGPRERHVELGSNHHLEIFAILDQDGNEKKWDGQLVSTYKAMQRLRPGSGEPLVQSEHGPGTRFKFSLAPGEMIELTENGERGLFVVRSISQQMGKDGKPYAPMVEFVAATDSRLKKEIKAAKKWRANPVNTLRKLACRKVVISPIGEVIESHD
jgi:CRISPR-associated endonuclease Csn1